MERRAACGRHILSFCVLKYWTSASKSWFLLSVLELPTIMKLNFARERETQSRRLSARKPIDGAGDV